jgi:hypothetical protein
MGRHGKSGAAAEYSSETVQRRPTMTLLNLLTSAKAVANARAGSSHLSGLARADFLVG